MEMTEEKRGIWLNFPECTLEDGEIRAIKQQSFIHSVARKLRTLDPMDITYEQAVKVREIFNW